MLLPATIFDPVKCRATFFFTLSFSEIEGRELEYIVKFIRLSTSGILSMKLYRNVVQLRVRVPSMECAFPLTGMATHTSFEHNQIYRAVRDAENYVDLIYCAIMQMHQLLQQLKGDLGWRSQYTLLR